MPQKITTTVRVKRKRKPQTRVVNKVVTKVTKKTRKKRRKRNISNVNSQLSQHLHLIANPCHGPLIRAIGNGSVVERVRLTTSINAAGTSTNGYFVWFPDFHNPGVVSTTPFNAFHWEGAASNTTPTNTTTVALGMSTVTTTGLAIKDPASGLVGAATAFSRAQSISACLQLDYLGALSNISGQVAIVKNFPYKAFATDTASATIAPPTVDDIFSFAGERERIQISGHEVVWRPSDKNAILRDSGNSHGYSAYSTNTAFTTGTNGSTVSLTSALDPDVLGVCIAWKGIPANANNFQINMVKAVNLEIEPSGYQIEPNFGSTVLEEGPSPIDHLTGLLDKIKPDWQSKAINTATNVIGSMAKMYAQNVGVNFTRSGLRGKGDDFRSIKNW